MEIHSNLSIQKGNSFKFIFPKMEIHLNLSIQKRKFIKIYISNELEILIRSPVFTNIIWIMLIRYKVFNLVHLSCYYKSKRGHFWVGEEQNIFNWLNTVQTKKCEGMELDKDKHKQLANLKKHKDTVHKSRKCIQNVVLKIGNVLI